MELTSGQAEARKKILSLDNSFNGKPKVLVVRGYAGVGKTTLLKVIREELGDIVAIAPTGKASLRLAEAAGVEPMTIHKYLYNPFRHPGTGEIQFDLKPTDQLRIGPNKILFMDESSMVGAKLWEDVYHAAERIEANIVAIGDNFQLGPVDMDKDEYFNMLDDGFMADDRVDMTEVTRVAAGNPIIRTSMLLREGKVYEALETVRRVMPSAFAEEAAKTYSAGGVVLVHKNITRHQTNAKIKSVLGIDTGDIYPGEPLLVLKNNYDLGVFNGEQITFNGWTKEPDEEHSVRDFYRGIDYKRHFGRASLGMNLAKAVLAKEEVIDGAVDANPMTVAKYVKKHYDSQTPYLSANLGYCLTTHKSQGSEWKSVLVGVEPSVRMNDRMGRRWLYTAVTRARENLAISFLKG